MIRYLTESLCIWLAFRLPKRIAYWAFIRVQAHATTVHPRKEMGAITCVDAANAWGKE